MIQNSNSQIFHKNCCHIATSYLSCRLLSEQQPKIINLVRFTSYRAMQTVQPKGTNDAIREI